MPTRRELLTTAALAAAGAALAPLSGCRTGQDATRADVTSDAAVQRAAPATAAPVERKAGMLMRKVPSTGEELPAIGLGTSGSFEVERGTPEFAALGPVLQVFFDGGGRVIDTSPNYGQAESVLGELLAAGGHRARCFLATKLAADDLETAKAQWAESQRRLRTERVELLQVHNLRAWRIQLPYARELKAQGLTRYVGLTHYRDDAHAELERLVRAERPDFLQINYSVSAPGAARTLLPAAQELGVAVLVNRAFDDGRLFDRVGDRPLPGWAGELGITSWAQLFLRFTLSHPAVTSVIPATGKPHRQADNLKGGTGPLLSQAQQAELVAQFA